MPWNPKGTIISMNNNACDSRNSLLLKTRGDAGYELAWLESELNKLEKSGGFTYIIAHIPVSQCLYEYRVRYMALMERY